jgi:N-acyl-L-homoserine lactone synthetase
MSATIFQPDSFSFLEVTDGAMLDKVFEFRYKVLKESEIFQDYFREIESLECKEYDRYDPYSVNFVAVDQDDEVVATIRLIHHSPLGYPTENDMSFDNTMFERDKLGEMSRIFVDAKYRSIYTTKIIMQGLKNLMYSKLIQLGIEYIYSVLEPRFVRLLRMYNICYEIIGEKQMHGKMGLQYPCLLYTQRLGDDNPEIVELWEKQREI